MAGSGGDGLTVSARTLRKRLAEKGMVIRQRSHGELLSRRVLEGRSRNVLQLVRGVLTVQSTISTISTSNPTGAPENGHKMVDSMVDCAPTPSAIHHSDPPFNPAGAPENAPDGGNGGNGGSRVGDTPLSNVVVDL
jgi:hypothetical protein